MPTTRISGYVFSPFSAASIVAEVWQGAEGQFWLETNDRPPQLVTIKDVSSPLSGVDNQIWFSDGQRFVTSQLLPDAFYGRNAVRWRGIAWLEKFNLLRLLAVVALIVLVVIGYQRAIPVLADAVIVVVPKSWDVAVGDSAWQSVDTLLFEPTALSENQQIEIKALFAPFIDIMANDGHAPRLLFRGAPLLGANALALPGGIIVVTDDLWLLLQDQPQSVQAILAHETEHVLRRHSMRQLIRYTGIATLILAFGLEDSIIEEMSLILSQGLLAGYSRTFETEADLGAARLMREIGGNPRAMIAALMALGPEFCDKGDCPEGGWFASHPDIDVRIRNLEKYLQ